MDRQTRYYSRSFILKHSTVWLRLLHLHSSFASSFPFPSRRGQTGLHGSDFHLDWVNLRDKDEWASPFKFKFPVRGGVPFPLCERKHQVSGHELLGQPCIILCNAVYGQFLLVCDSPDDYLHFPSQPVSNDPWGASLGAKGGGVQARYRRGQVPHVQTSGGWGCPPGKYGHCYCTT